MKKLLPLCLLITACQRQGTEIRLVVQPPATNNYPSHLAQWLGFYKQEGLNVTISNIAGASKVLEALVGSSAEVGSGVYEQTIQMAADGRRIVSFVSLLRSPNFALITTSDAVKTVVDLKGKTVGVSSVGSPSQFYLNFLLKGVGVPPEEVGTAGIGQGATAAAAVERQQVAAAVVFGSAITVAQKRGARILADSRTPDGLRAIFGVDDYPASCLLAREEWLRANPDAARRMTRAIVRTLAWIQQHSAEEILARVPSEFRVGDKDAELEAIRLAKPMYSTDGRIRAGSAEAVRRVLEGSLERVREAKIDLSRTYTNEFLP
jgi:sulfonate transport system substrate-binding protein